MQALPITTLSEAWKIADPWRELVVDSPLHSPEWLLTWWKHFGTNKQLNVLATHDYRGSIVGIAPLFSGEALGTYHIEMLGSGTVCTDYNRILVRKNELEDSVSAIACVLNTQFLDLPSICSSELIIDGVDRNEKTIVALCDYLNSFGFSTWNKPIDSSYRIALPNTWQEMSRQFSSSARRKANKASSRLSSGECTFHFTSDPDHIAHYMPELERLHQLRRSSLGQAGSYATPNFSLFLNEAIGLLSEQGKVRLEWCESEGNIIAIHLLLLGDDTVYMYQSGIDPKYVGLEPGHFLTASAIRNAIIHGSKTYDFLRGDEPYKAFWGGVQVPLYRMYFCPPRLLSKLVGGIYKNIWDFKNRFVKKQLVGPGVAQTSQCIVAK